MAKAKTTVAEEVTVEQVESVSVEVSKQELGTEDFQGWPSRDLIVSQEPIVESAPLEPIEPPVVK